MENREPIRLAIVGGGFGGLTFAHCLAKFIPDWEKYLKIDVYEATGSLLAQVGTGIGVWPIVWGVLKELGIFDELMQYTLDRPINEPTEMLLLRRADKTVGQDLFKMISTGNILFFHRGDFQAVLLKHLPPSITLHTNKRLRTYTQDENGVVLQFEDGTTEKADIVIGADGVRSPVRKTLYEEVAGGPITADPHPADPTWTGLVTYRTLIPREKLVAQGWENHRALSSWTVYTGKGAAMMAYPVSNGANVNFIGFRIWPEYEGTQFREEVMAEILRKEGYERPQAVEAKTTVHQNVAENDVWSMEGAQGSNGKRVRWFTRVSPDEVKHAYGSWEPEVKALVNGIESPICWAVHGVGGLKSWVNKKVALLGDSAHAMPPQQGVGGSSAICDGYVLSKLFAHAISTDPSKLSDKVEEILRTYDEIRRPIANDVAAASRACCRHFNRNVREEHDGKEVWKLLDSDKEDEMKRLQDELTNGWCYAWDRNSVSESADKAIELLKTRY